MFIIAVAGEVYLQSKNTFIARAALSSVNENGRFAIQEIRRILSMAGMGINAREAEQKASSAIVPVSSGLKSDAIAIRYRRGSTCSRYIDLGNSAAPATVNLMIRNDQLMCRQDKGRSQPLVSGIKTMKILYGFDDTDDGYVNRYLTAKDVEKIATSPGLGTAWQRVVSFRVGLLVFSSNYSLPVEMRAQTDTSIQLPSLEYTVMAGDKYLYKVFSTTIYLRNLSALLQSQ